MTIRRMRIARWIPKATNTYTHTGCVTLIAFPLPQWWHEHASVLRDTYSACLVYGISAQCITVASIFCA